MTRSGQAPPVASAVRDVFEETVARTDEPQADDRGFDDLASVRLAPADVGHIELRSRALREHLVAKLPGAQTR